MISLPSYSLPHYFLLLSEYGSIVLWPDLDRRALALFTWDCRPFLRVLSTYYAHVREEEKASKEAAETKACAEAAASQSASDSSQSSSSPSPDKVKVKKNRDTFARSTTKVCTLVTARYQFSCNSFPLCISSAFQCHVAWFSLSFV